MKKQLLFLIIILLPFFAHAQWQYAGLKGKDIYRLRVHDAFIYAATDQGLYKKNMTTTDTLWTNTGFASQQVNCVYPLNNNTIYAGVQHSGSGSDTIALYVSYDGGATWQGIWGGYDTDLNMYTQITDIEISTADTNKIIVLGAGIRRSVDAGHNFSKENYLGGRFLTMASTNDNRLFTGGEGPVLNPYLLQSVDNGDNWNNNTDLNQIVNGDNACLSATIHPANADIAYIGMEGYIGKTTDNGSSWTKHLESDYYMKSVRVSPSDHKVVYATGGRFGGTDIPLFTSKDSGNTWDTTKFGISVTVADVREMAVSNYTGVDMVYLSPYKEGVYRYQTTTVGIPAQATYEPDIIYPNPFTKTAVVKPGNNTAEKLKLAITDLSGRVIKEWNYDHNDMFIIDREGIASGVYFLHITGDTGAATVKKLVIQ